MTTVVRWQPMTRRSMRPFNEFERMFTNMTNQPTTAVALPLDVTETDDVYTVHASVPGINPDAVEIIFDDNALTIKGETTATEEVEGAKYHLRERRSGSFSRSIKFPLQIEADAIAASYDNGILTLTLPKAEVVKPKRIEVKVS